VFGKQKTKKNLKAMEKTNHVQKTENKPIAKTISKTFAIVISLLLISFTVSAQGFWKQILVNNTYGKMAELMVEQKNAADRLLKASAPTSGTMVAVPVNSPETAPQITFESYFGSQWNSNKNGVKTPIQTGRKLDE
jgi:hypothetical protein